jgi:hypothetical protein
MENKWEIIKLLLTINFAQIDIDAYCLLKDKCFRLQYVDIRI